VIFIGEEDAPIRRQDLLAVPRIFIGAKMGRNASYSDLASGMVLKGSHEMKAPSDVARARAHFYRDSSHMLRPSFAGRKLSVRYRVIMWGNDLVLDMHLTALSESHFK
jgi:hypothetical protein